MRTSMKSWLSRLTVMASLGLAAVSAQAGDKVYWAVNVDAPVQGMGRVSTAVSNTRGGVYTQPGVVVYAPPPVVVHHPRPPMVVMPGYGYGYGPAPVVYAPPSRIYRVDRWDRGGRWDRDDRGRHHHHHRHDERRFRDDDRDTGRGGWRDR